MGAVPDSATLRARLCDLVQESDVHRPLDSLEAVVVRTYLSNHALGAPSDPGQRPGTIEGWVAWAVRHSLDS